MIDPKLIRFTPEVVVAAMRRRHSKLDLNVLITLEERRRTALNKAETLKAERDAAGRRGDQTAG